MDETQAKKIVDTVFRDVFGIENSFSMETIKRSLCHNIDLPVETVCSVTNKKTWVYDPDENYRILSDAAKMQMNKDAPMMMPKKPLGSMEDVLGAWKEINFLTSEKVVSSQEVAESDSVTTSANVFHSSLVMSSKNIVYSSNLINSNHMVASKGSNSCSMGIRMFDNIYCSSSFEVKWSSKVSKSMFIVDCLDLYECLFCFDIRSKKYCVANIQLEKDEYMKVKAMIVKWIMDKYMHGAGLFA